MTDGPEGSYFPLVVESRLNMLELETELANQEGLPEGVAYNWGFQSVHIDRRPGWSDALAHHDRNCMMDYEEDCGESESCGFDE